jgi:hypothetical protein
MVMSYSDYIGYDQCPRVSKPCGSDETADCGGLSLNGFFYSNPWSRIARSKTPMVRVIYAQFDNYGSIGSVLSSDQGTNSCALGTISSSPGQQAIIEGNQMKIGYTATNAVHGGPYGVISATLEWYWE